MKKTENWLITLNPLQGRVADDIFQQRTKNRNSSNTKLNNVVVIVVNNEPNLKLMNTTLLILIRLNGCRLHFAIMIP